MRKILRAMILLLLGTALPDSHSLPQVTVQPPVHDPRTLVRVTVEELVLNPGIYHDQLVVLTSLVRHGDGQDQSSDIFRLREPGRICHSIGDLARTPSLAGWQVILLSCAKMCVESRQQWGSV